jgi:hypothetical protein
MAAARIYVDTSVLGGCFDTEFSASSNGLVDDFRRGLLRAVLSDVTAEEIGRAPAAVQAVHQELVSLGAELVSVSPEVLELVVAYEARAILGARFETTCCTLPWQPWRPSMCWSVGTFGTSFAWTGFSSSTR